MKHLLTKLFLSLTFTVCIVSFIWNVTQDNEKYRLANKQTSNKPEDSSNQVDPFTLVEETQTKRKQILQTFCNNYYRDQPKPNVTDVLSATQTSRRIVLSKSYKFAYCSNPKTGSSTRSYILYNAFHPGKNVSEATLNNTIHEQEDPAVTKMNKVPVKQRFEIMDEYYTFMFVREPLNRLLSAYYNRVLYHHEKMHNFYRTSNNATKFLVDLARVIKSKAKLEHHFQTIFEHCNPCVLNFDFIAHQETMDQDMKYIIHQIPGLSEVANVAKPRQVTETKVKTSLPDYSLIPQALSDIVQYYYADFAAFGYSFPE